MGKFYVVRVQEWRQDFPVVFDPDFGGKLKYVEDGAATAIELEEGETVDNVGVMPLSNATYERMRDGERVSYTPYAFQALIGRTVDEEEVDSIVSPDPPEEMPGRDKKKDIILPGMPPPGSAPMN